MVCLFLLPTKTISIITYIHYCPTWIFLLALRVVIPCILWGNDWECFFTYQNNNSHLHTLFIASSHSYHTTCMKEDSSNVMTENKYFICLFVCLFVLFTYQHNIHIAYCIIPFLESSSCLLCGNSLCLVRWSRMSCYLFVCLFVCLFYLFTYQHNIHIVYCIIPFLESSSCLLCGNSLCLVRWSRMSCYLFVCLFVCLFYLFTYQHNIHIVYCIIPFLESSSCLLCGNSLCLVRWWSRMSSLFVCLFVCLFVFTYQHTVHIVYCIIP